MKEELKTRKQIEKSKTPIAGFFMIGLGCLLLFILFPLGLAVMAIGIVMCIIELGSYAKYKVAPPEYIAIICPYCNTGHDVISNAKTFVCTECKNRILIEGEIGKKIN